MKKKTIKIQSGIVYGKGKGEMTKIKVCSICKKPTIVWWHCPYCNKEYWICYNCGAMLKETEPTKKEKDISRWTRHQKL